MNTRTKITVDRLVGLPLVWLLNGAARVLGRLLRRNHSSAVEDVRTIAISKYVGMGSIIQATPLIRSLRRAYPGATIIMVTGTSSRRLVERLEHVDRIITVDDGGLFALIGTTLRALVQLMRAKVDLYFDLELYSAYASIVALASLARNRIGFYRESAQHKKGIYTHLMYFNTRHPIRLVYLQLGRSVGCEPDQPDRLGRIRVGQADRAELAGRLARAGVEPGCYLVVNPNASDLLVERRWPAGRFAALIDGLLARHELSVVLIGSPGERPYVAGLVEQVTHPDRGRVVDLAGELSLGGLFALLEGARCLVTNDTGPMHMAWALEVPTVCLFGPVDPHHYGWAKSGVEVLYSRVYCSPCVHEVDNPPCGGDNICMQRIGVARVGAAVDRILDSSPPDRARPFRREFFVDPVHGPLGLVVRESIAEIRSGGGAPRGASRPPSAGPGPRAGASGGGRGEDPFPLMIPPSTAHSTCPICTPGPAGPAGPREPGTVAGYPLKRCPGCGFQWLDPQPDELTLAGIYQQGYYESWGLHSDESSTRAMKLATFGRLLAPLGAPAPAAPRLLDCGAATGYLMEAAQELGMEPYGIELTEFGVDRITRRFGPDRVWCGTLDQAACDGLDSEPFDIITMIDFLEHVRDPVGTLARAYHLLTPGGRLVILTPDVDSLSRRVMGARWLHYKVEHLSYFSPRSLSRALRQAGFAAVRVGRGWKTMNLHYVAHQLRTYAHPLLTPVVRALHRLSPPALRRANFPITFGEMLAEATRAGAAAGAWRRGDVEASEAS
jgi:ADP-heptose:LPS heptosyltransferase/2-polyprenyl-3-methyl-5-hydroxy-6-metoxy-1,4-benzoquinol methylase